MFFHSVWFSSTLSMVSITLMRAYTPVPGRLPVNCVYSRKPVLAAPPVCRLCTLRWRLSSMCSRSLLLSSLHMRSNLDQCCVSSADLAWYVVGHLRWRRTRDGGVRLGHQHEWASQPNPFPGCRSTSPPALCYRMLVNTR